LDMKFRRKSNTTGNFQNPPRKLIICGKGSSVAKSGL